jgi:multidrug efflux pump subunit AcrA (membrane-fusion protein)
MDDVGRTKGRRRAAATLAAAVVVTCAFVSCYGEDRAGSAGDKVNGIVLTDSGPALTLRKQTFEWTLRRRGKLEPLEEENVSVQTWGVIARMSEEGTSVKKGDIVLELDKEEIDRRIADRAAEVAICEAELVQTRRRQAKLVKSAEIAVRRAEIELEWQRLGRQILLSGASSEDLARAEKEFETRKLVARNRREELAIFDALAAKGFATASETGRKRLQIAEAKLEHEKAKIAHKKLLDGPTDLEKKEAELQVKIAEYALSSARKKVSSAEAASRGAVAHADKRLASERHRLKRDEEDLEKYTICSPADGFILHTPDRWGNPWAPGRFAWRGCKIMSVPSEGRVKVTTKVGHSDVEWIEIDQPCRVTVAARRGEPYEGKVTKVGSQGRDEYEDLDSYTKDKVARAGRKAFDVEVEVLGSDPSLMPGFRAEVEFLLGEVDDALVVPWGAVEVISADDGRYVHVVAGGRLERRKVELGESDEANVVIASGCKEGEMVLLARTAR